MCALLILIRILYVPHTAKEIAKEKYTVVLLFWFLYIDTSCYSTCYVTILIVFIIGLFSYSDEGVFICWQNLEDYSYNAIQFVSGNIHYCFGLHLKLDI
jgi:hypothetical protein